MSFFDYGTFHAPSLDDEFFPGALLFGDTPFEIDRLIFVRLVMTVLLLAFFYFGLRRARIVPRGLQNMVEYGMDFVRLYVGEEILGKEQGRRFMPLLMTVFFMVLALNLSSIIPFLNISSDGLIGPPLVLAVLSYISFNYAGIKKHGVFRFFKSTLVIPNVPWPLLILLVPIEFVSTFIIRPFTLTVRLMANMLSGHILLVLFFGATQFFFFGEAAGWLRPFGAATLIVGFVMTLFELLIIVLQAYIFVMLTAVYIDLALHADEH